MLVFGGFIPRIKMGKYIRFEIDKGYGVADYILFGD